MSIEAGVSRRRDISQYLDRISRSVAIACAFVLGASSYIYADAGLPAVEKPFLRGKYDMAVYEAKKLVDDHCRQREEVYYLKGLSELKLGKFQDARESFGMIISKYPRSNRVFDAHIGIADSYLLEGSVEKAVKLYSEIKEKFPSDSNVALINARIDECRARAGLAARPAIHEEEKVVIKHPDAESVSNSQDAVKKYVTVQAGCFKSRGNAEKLSSRLSSKGYDSYVEMPLAAGEKLYRVKVGRFKTRAEAEDAASRLNKIGYKTKICDDISCR